MEEEFAVMTLEERIKDAPRHRALMNKYRNHMIGNFQQSPQGVRFDPDNPALIPFLREPLQRVASWVNIESDKSLCYH